MFKKIKKPKIYNNATIIAEFKHTNDTYLLISELSKYIHNICKKEDIVTTDIQLFSAGYKVTFNLKFVQHRVLRFLNTNYSRKLANVSNWIVDRDSNTQTLSKYHYSYNIVDIF